MMDITTVAGTNVNWNRPIPNIARAGKNDDMAPVRKSAQEFEAFFLSQMFSHMFSGLGENIQPEFGGSHAEKLWRPLLIAEYAEQAAAAGGIGIADKIIEATIKAKGMENG